MLVTCDLNHAGTASMKHAISVCTSVVVTPWWLSPVLSPLHLWYKAVKIAAAASHQWLQPSLGSMCLYNNNKQLAWIIVAL